VCVNFGKSFTFLTELVGVKFGESFTFLSKLIVADP
jgi:hypothetical protein